MIRFRTILPFCLLPLFACKESSSPATDENGEGTVDSGIVTVSATDGGTTGTGGESVSVGSSGATMSGADSMPGMDFNCGEVDFQLQAIPPNVVLVLDKSGSMVSMADNDGDGQMDGFWDADNDPMTPDISRWNSLYNVVDFVVSGFDTQINFGAQLFPSEDATNQYSLTACTVENSPEIAVAPMNAAAILAGIPAAMETNIRGATPTTKGIENAVAHLQTLDPEVPRFMILVTDGAANCGADYPTVPDALEMYDEHVADTVDGAFTNQGIPTFVVGIDIVDALTGVGADGAPEANTFVELNAVAVAGGRPRDGDEKFYNTVNEIELMAALAEIAGETLSCIVPLDPPPEHPDFVEVQIGGMVIDKVDDCATEDGWVYVNPDGPYDAIELCGSACDLLADVGTVDATYGCPPPG